jgi:hypothetical protein
LNRLIGDQRLRQRGFTPKWTDGEVLTMEVVGEFLSLETDQHIGPYFRQHWPSWFPQRGSRTPLAQQAAHLWAIKQQRHQQWVIDLGAVADPIPLVEGCPLPLCVLTRAARCRGFAGEADSGYCAAKKQFYYGFHGHRRVTLEGVMTAWTVTSASGDEREALWDLTHEVQGRVMGDQGSIRAFLKAEFAPVGMDLQTPLRANRTDPRALGVVQRLMTTRRRVETVMSPLAERFHFEKIRARDQWHLTSRMARKVLAHPLCIFVNRLLGRSDLPFEGLIA